MNREYPSEAQDKIMAQSVFVYHLHGCWWIGDIDVKVNFIGYFPLLLIEFGLLFSLSYH